MQPTIELRGEMRTSPGGTDSPCLVGLDATTVAIRPETGVPLEFRYDEIRAVRTADLAVTLELDGGIALELRRFGPQLTLLVSTLRERRVRQVLGERLVTLPADPLELLDAAMGDWAGRAWLVHHPWGIVFIPIEPDGPWRWIRRRDIAEVREETTHGTVHVGASDGSAVELRRLGAHSHRHAAALRELAAGARADAAAIVTATLPAASLSTRLQLAGLLVDGLPVSRATLGAIWDEAVAGFVAQGEVGAHLARLVDASAGGERWLAVAPVRPGTPEPKSWAFVGLPGGLVAMEVVTAGAHATYCFRTTADGADTLADPDADRLVGAISDALVDLRFLREPIALPVDRLAAGGRRDYRRVVAAFPSVRTARAHFAGRIVHDDGWDAALADLIAWATSGRAGPWPGRTDQERRIDAAGEGEAAGDEEVVDPGDD